MALATVNPTTRADIKTTMRVLVLPPLVPTLLGCVRCGPDGEGKRILEPKEFAGSQCELYGTWWGQLSSAQ
jgi:hypothetical protein